MHRPRPTLSRPVASVAVLAVVLALGACTSSDELDVDGFSPGTCTEVAPTLQDVDEALRQVGAEDLEPAEAGERFRAAQDVLKQAGTSATPPLDSSLTELVTQLGFFRISVDTNAYDGSQRDDARTALEALARQCRPA